MTSYNIYYECCGCKNKSRLQTYTKIEKNGPRTARKWGYYYICTLCGEQNNKKYMDRYKLRVQQVFIKC